MPAAIQIDHITKKYQGADHEALQEIVLDIPEGSIFGLLGPNGAGKTTLISILCGLLNPTSGSFTIHGIPSSDLRGTKNIIGVVPQEYALYPTLTAYENLMYFGSLYNVPKAILKQRIKDSLAHLGLESYTHRKIKIFSGGMKRRVNLIAGILHQPKVLFLDEPTVGVDVQSRTAIIAYLQQMNQSGTSLVYTSHLMGEAEDFCSDIAIIDRGQVLVQGSPVDLINKSSTASSLEGLFLSLTGKTLRDA